MNNFIKIVKILFNILMDMILVVGIILILLYILGIEPFVVESGSMQPTIEKGSLSFINKQISYDKIKENDVIAFTVITGQKVTHRVVKITSQGFETQGDSNEKSDGISTTKMNYIGKNIFSIPKLGYAVKIMQTPRGKIILCTIILFIFVAGITMDDNKKEKRKKGKRYL